MTSRHLLTLAGCATLVGPAVGDPTPPTPDEIAAVPVNQAGWPLTTYAVFAGTLGSGANEQSHDVAHGIAANGWLPYIDKEIQPLLDGPNPPARIVLHCVGPAWPRLRDGDIHRDKKSGRPIRWFEYDWPLTVAEGRERTDGGVGRWPPMPAYVDGFADAWRSVADGSRSGGRPIQTYAYTGMLRTTWLEELLAEDPEAYRERIVRVAEFFKACGFAGMYVDAAASEGFPDNHLGLRTLAQLNDLPDFFVGVEAYPAAKHDAITARMPYFVSHFLLKRFHPRWPDFVYPEPTWHSRLPRTGLVVWHNDWGGGKYALTPESARKVAAMGDAIGVSWRRWNELAPDLPRQLPKIRRGQAKATSTAR